MQWKLVPKKCINVIILETEIAIRIFEPKWHNIYRFQDIILIKRITEKHKQNPPLKHQLKVINNL